MIMMMRRIEFFAFLLNNFQSFYFCVYFYLVCLMFLKLAFDVYLMFDALTIFQN